jgi:hypothetical protein
MSASADDFIEQLATNQVIALMPCLMQSSKRASLPWVIDGTNSDGRLGVG